MFVRGSYMLIALFVVALAAAGCDGDDEEAAAPSASSLERLLPPPNEVGPLRLERSLSWDNPTDFVVQGTVLPEAKPPSSAVAQMEDAGFAAAAGSILVPRGGGSPVNVSVAAFDSEDGAVQAQDYLHDQDLQQPCFAACAVSPQELAINDIPGATAVHQVPTTGELPPGTSRFEAFAAEFTIGEDLFYVHASGDPGDIPPAAFERGTAAVYDHASQTAG
jgi:hypothetical protein